VRGLPEQIGDRRCCQLLLLLLHSVPRPFLVPGKLSPPPPPPAPRPAAAAAAGLRASCPCTTCSVIW
jgi:hypothetical protein